MKLLAVVAAAALTLTAAAKADPLHPDFQRISTVMRITESFGGWVGAFIHRYVQLRDSGGRLIIAGPCESACTTFFGIMPRERVCATPSAVLGFHTPTEAAPHPFIADRHSPAGADYTWAMYPDRVRVLLRFAGWNGDNVDQEHPEMIRFDNESGLGALVAICDIADW